MGRSSRERVGAKAIRGWTAPALGLVSAGLVVWTALHSGGYFPSDVELLSAVSLLAVAAGLVLAPERWRPAPRALAALAALLGLAAWAGISSGWSSDPGGADLELRRSLGYAAAFTLALLACGNGRHAALLLKLLVASLLLICGIALISRLRPLLLTTDPLLLTYSQGRLSYPIGYWNGLGAIAAMGLLGATGLAADQRAGWLERGAWATGATVSVVALYLTLSRASIIAGVLALAVLLALSPWRRRLLGSAAIAILAGAAGVLVLRATPILIDAPSTVQDQSREGGRVLLIIVAIVLAAGAVQAALARLPARSRYRRARNVPGAVTAAAVLLLLAVGVAGYAAAGDQLEGRAAGGVIGARAFVDRQRNAFLDPADAPVTGQRRLVEARSSRSEAYRVAWGAFTDHPLQGDGAAGFPARWYRDRKIDESLRNVHSLELETLAELGLVGGATLAALLALLSTGLTAVRRRTRAVTRCEAASAGGILVTWLVHSALDWDWQLAAVTLPALICGALLLTATGASASRGRDSRRTGTLAHRPAPETVAG